MEIPMGLKKLLVGGLVCSVVLVAAGPITTFARRGGQQASGATAGVLQTRETNVAGVVAELTECRREQGVLSIKMRLRNTSNRSQSVDLTGGYDKYYVIAGTKKYLVLRDSDKTPLASPPAFPGIESGQSWIWWAKYPAPPASETKINYMTPLGPPFENVPISD
jgi:hypothetical protein